MTSSESFQSFAQLLPAALQPYAMWVLLGVAVLLVVACWRVISLLMRISWVLRLLLLLGSIGAFTGVRGCAGTAQNSGGYSIHASHR